MEEQDYDDISSISNDEEIQLEVQDEKPKTKSQVLKEKKEQNLRRLENLKKARERKKQIAEEKREAQRLLKKKQKAIEEEEQHTEEVVKRMTKKSDQKSVSSEKIRKIKEKIMEQPDTVEEESSEELVVIKEKPKPKKRSYVYVVEKPVDKPQPKEIFLEKGAKIPAFMEKYQEPKRRKPKQKFPAKETYDDYIDNYELEQVKAVNPRQSEIDRISRIIFN